MFFARTISTFPSAVKYSTLPFAFKGTQSKWNLHEKYVRKGIRCKCQLLAGEKSSLRGKLEKSTFRFYLSGSDHPSCVFPRGGGEGNELTSYKISVLGPIKHVEQKASAQPGGVRRNFPTNHK